MKKFLTLAACAFVIGGCAKEDMTPDASFDPAAETRTINDIFTVTNVGYLYLGSWYQAEEIIYSDGDGNLYCGYKHYFSNYDVTTGTWSIFRKEVLSDAYYIRALAVDNQGNWVVSNYYHFAKVSADLTRVVDFSSFFPEGSIFLGVCTAPNGNMFVSVASGDIVYYAEGYFQSCTKQKIYRLSAAGVLTLLAEVDMGYDHWQARQSNKLMKAKGVNLYGANHEGYFRLNTNTGVVDYYTPTIPIKAYAAAIDQANLYALSGNMIVELKPNGSYAVVGMIPIGAIDANDSWSYSFAANADATVFYFNCNGVIKLSLP